MAAHCNTLQHTATHTATHYDTHCNGLTIEAATREGMAAPAHVTTGTPAARESAAELCALYASVSKKIVAAPAPTHVCVREREGEREGG